MARHELGASLDDVLSAAVKVLKGEGRLCIIYPAHRCVDLLTHMRAFGLEPKKIRMAHSKENSSAELVYAEGVKGGRAGIEVLSPLIVHEDLR